MNYVFLGDSPTLESGFARVVKNIIPNLNLPNKHLWGIGYKGEQHNYDFNIYPANIESSWESQLNIKRFENFLLSFNGPITLWTIHDPFRLANFLPAINAVRKKKKLRLVSYIPVDSYLNTLDDTLFLNEVDTIVSYTNFGKKCIENVISKNKEIKVIPHGNDEDFRKLKSKKDILFPDNIENKILGVVNSNSERKNLFRSFEIFYYLHDLDPNWRLYVHSDPNGYYNFKQIALEMKILDKCIFADPFFETGIIGETNCSKEQLIDIYNCLDLFLSTSHGEGWGLTVTEAASCEVPIAIGNHTSFGEIFDNDSAIFLQNSQPAYYMKKIVHDFDSLKSAQKILTEYPRSNFRTKNAKKIVEKFKWEEINKQWENIIK